VEAVEMTHGPINFRRRGFQIWGVGRYCDEQSGASLRLFRNQIPDVLLQYAPREEVEVEKIEWAEGWSALDCRRCDWSMAAAQNATLTRYDSRMHLPQASSALLTDLLQRPHPISPSASYLSLHLFLSSDLFLQACFKCRDSFPSRRESYMFDVHDGKVDELRFLGPFLRSLSQLVHSAFGEEVRGGDGN
jgi:hypothetical protein